MARFFRHTGAGFAPHGVALRRFRLVRQLFGGILPLLALLTPTVLSAQASVNTAGQNRSRESGLGLNTVVIDPGHGGNDPGCISKDKKTKEKTLTLDISRRLAKKIRAAYPEIKVIQTRNTDVFVPLVQRAQIANNAHANLFISIHINAIAGTAPNGCSVHVLGQSSKKGRDLYSNNFNECARENSVILLEEDYSTNYQGFDPNDPESSILFSLMQNAYLEQSLMFADNVSRALLKGPFKGSRGVHQDPFLVLWKTAMPAVLVECGFISNSSDLAVLRSDDKLDEIADRLLEAFTQFKTDYDRSLNIQETPQKSAATGFPVSQTENTESPAQKSPKAESPVLPTANTESPSHNSAETVWYGTQILALSRILPEGDAAFKGMKAEVVRDGSIYRYIAGRSADRESALAESKKIREKFPDSFLVRVSPGGKVERQR